MSHNTFSTNASRIIFQKSHHSLGKLSFITHVANKGHGQSIKNLYHINHSLNNCVKAVTSLVSHNWDIYSTDRKCGKYTVVFGAPGFVGVLRACACNRYQAAFPPPLGYEVRGVP